MLTTQVSEMSIDQIKKLRWNELIIIRQNLWKGAHLLCEGCYIDSWNEGKACSHWSSRRRIFFDKSEYVSIFTLIALNLTAIKRYFLFIKESTYRFLIRLTKIHFHNVFSLSSSWTEAWHLRYFFIFERKELPERSKRVFSKRKVLEQKTLFSCSLEKTAFLATLVLFLLILT